MPEYINALPFIGPFQLGALKSDFKFVTAPPRDLNMLMAEKKLFVSLVSAIYYLENKEQLELMYGVGIGAKYKVQSVCLFYPEALKSLDGVTVALDPESATSNRVIQWILTKVKKQNPHFVIAKNVIEGPLHTAFLLIGDRCLAFGCPKGYKIMDLGEEWMNATQLPLPFGVIVADKKWHEKHPGALQSLKQDLLNALSWSLDHKKELYTLAKRQTNLSEEVVLSYWDHLAYVFDHRYKESLDFMEKNI
jgi:predicted solute-binding protein